MRYIYSKRVSGRGIILCCLALSCFFGNPANGSSIRELTSDVAFGRWQDAQSKLQRITTSTLSPNEKSKFCLLELETLRQTGDLRSTIAKGENYIASELTPGDRSHALVLLADCKARLKDFQGAVEDLNTLLPLADNAIARDWVLKQIYVYETEQALVNALAMSSEGKQEEAVEAYDELLARELNEVMRRRVQTLRLLYLAKNGHDDVVAAEGPVVLSYGPAVFGLDRLAREVEKAAGGAGNGTAANNIAEFYGRRYPRSDGRTPEVSERLSQANALAKEYKNSEAIEVLDEIIADEDNTPAGHEALDLRAHLALREKDTTGAVQYFERLLQSLGSSGIETHLAEKAQSRLAVLYKQSGRIKDCNSLLQHLAANSWDMEVASHAAVNLLANEFEVLQRAMQAGETVATENWEALQGKLREFAECTTATVSHRATGQLMLVETYDWTDDPKQALVTTNEFRDRFDELTHLDQAGTVRYMESMALISLGDLESAKDVLQWTVDANQFRRHVWPNTNILERTYFQLWTCCRKTGDYSRADEVEKEFKAKFPVSSYARVMDAWVRPTSTTSAQNGGVK